MKITDTVDMGGDADLSVDMELREEPSDRVRPFRVRLAMYAEEQGNEPRRELFSVSANAKSPEEAGDAAIEHFAKWLGRASASVHASAVRMRRMLEREEGGK